MLALTVAIVSGNAPKLNAGSVSTTLPVSGTITPACSVTATSISFGELADGLVVHSNGSLTVTCPNGLPYKVALNAGANAAGFPLFRTMKNTSSPTALIGYQLFKDSGLTAEWGDSGAGNTYTAGTPLNGTGIGTAQQLTVYGLQNGFLAGNSGITGTYTDTVLATVIF